MNKRKKKMYDARWLEEFVLRELRAREAANEINGRSSEFFCVNYARQRARETPANRSRIMKMETCPSDLSRSSEGEGSNPGEPRRGGLYMLRPRCRLQCFLRKFDSYDTRPNFGSVLVEIFSTHLSLRSTRGDRARGFIIRGNFGSWTNAIRRSGSRKFIS